MIEANRPDRVSHVCIISPTLPAACAHDAGCHGQIGRCQRRRQHMLAGDLRLLVHALLHVRCPQSLLRLSHESVVGRETCKSMSSMSLHDQLLTELLHIQKFDTMLLVNALLVCLG